MRAILLASAIAATFVGRRSSNLRKALSGGKIEVRLSAILTELGIDRTNFEVSENLEDALLKEAIAYIRQRGRGGSYFCTPDLS